MLQFRLNPRKPYNYAFFCPVSKMHLTVSNPLGYAEGVTPAIFRALKSNTIIDVDGVVDLQTGKVKVAKQDNKAEKTIANPDSAQTPVTTSEDAVAASSADGDAADAANTKKRGRKSSNSEMTANSETE